MSDIPVLIGGLTQSEFASARASWANAGHDDAAFLAGMGVTAAPPPAAPVKPAQPPAAYQPDTFGSHLSREQVALAVRSLTAAGMAPDKIAAELAADGLMMPEGDDRTPDQIAHDAEYLAGPYSADQYEIDWRETGLIDKPIAELASMQKDYAELLSELRMSPQIGGRFIERMLKLSQELRQPAPEKQEQWKLDGKAEIDRRFPGEKLNVASENIKAALSLANNTAIVEALCSGLLNDPWAFSSLAAHAERLVEWAARRPEGKRK
jgi:hypothetical protein